MSNPGITFGHAAAHAAVAALEAEIRHGIVLQDERAAVGNTVIQEMLLPMWAF